MGNRADIAASSVPVVCPSCENVLYVPRGSNGGLHTGDTLEVVCLTCAKTIEILAPAGIEAFARGVADERVVRFTSEFATTEAHPST